MLRLTCIATALGAAAAFAPSAPPSLRPSARAASLRAAGGVAGVSMLSEGTFGQGAASSWADVEKGRKPMQVQERTLEEWLEKFKDPRGSIRTIAAKCVAADYDSEGKGDEVIAKLMEKMVAENVEERRTAVQCLGMIGDVVLEDITELMMSTEDMVVRASCAKTIGAVALKNPETVDQFPQYCIDAMVKAATEIPDPVTKLAVMSGLSQIGGYCERGLDAIIEISKRTSDVALLTQSMNALGSIAENNPEWVPKVKAGLMATREAHADNEDGGDIVDAMIQVQLDKVEGGGFINAAKDSTPGDNDAALDAMASFFSVPGAKKKK
mmetsp:Transcript_38175/g.97582  ORF Transcript_38175/g.97582 Transcript_38175/m.97582 type:complete len:325 (-) Transcript_38175:33-1007(-)